MRAFICNDAWGSGHRWTVECPISCPPPEMGEVVLLVEPGRPTIVLVVESERLIYLMNPTFASREIMILGGRLNRTHLSERGREELETLLFNFK